MKKNDIQFKIKDKIFLFLAITGFILAFYFRIFDSGNQENNYNVWQVFSQISQKELVDDDKLELRIRHKNFQVEIAKSDEKKDQGLSGRDFLDEEKGMAFILLGESNNLFLMNGVNFDLDFIFIDNGEIVELIKKIPSSFEGNLVGDSHYDTVIEMNAGWLDQNGVIVGDSVFVKK